MKRYHRGIAAIMVCIVIPVMAGELDLDRVPADSALVAHLDWEGLGRTELGRYLLDQLGQPDVQQKLDTAALVVGFDLRTDVKAVTLCSQPRGQTEPNNIVLVHGTFDRERLEAAVAAMEGHARTTHQEDTIHQWVQKENGRTVFGALPLPNLLVYADNLETMRQALDVIHGRAPSLQREPGGFAVRVPAPSPLLLVAVAMDRMPKAEGQVEALQGGRSALLTIGETAGELNANAELVFSDAQQADRVRAMIEGFAAMLAMNAQENPELAQLADRLKARASGETVRLELNWPAEKLIEAMKKARQQALEAPVVEEPATAPSPEEPGSH